MLINCTKFFTETYQSRVKRSLIASASDDNLDIEKLERGLIEEAGENFCVYDKICEKYAATTLQQRNNDYPLDWKALFR